MNIQNKNIVITGAANGIGHALAKRMSEESPKSIILIDIKSSLKEVARSLNADSYIVDVSNEDNFSANIVVFSASSASDTDETSCLSLVSSSFKNIFNSTALSTNEVI